MDICRTCLKSPANKHILELEKDLKEGNHDSFGIMLFCLGIEVIEDSKITTNLCNNCYRKIISFYKFKTLSLKNDVYLKSMAQTQLEDEKLSVYVDENGIKHENLLDPDEFGPNLVEECNAEFEIDIDLKEDKLLGDVEINVKNEKKYESDEEPLSVVQKVKYENTKDDSKGIESVCERPKEEKSQEKVIVIQERHVYEQHQQAGEQGMIRCKLCPKLFATISGRARHHKSIHLGISRVESKSKCYICDREVKYLKQHIKYVHNQETLPYGCDSCERRFRCRSALNIHMAWHSDVQDLPYQCDICNKKFRIEAHLQQHQQSCERGMVRCKLCPKLFATISGRAKHHKSIHLGISRVESKSKCDICNREVKYLKQHIKYVHNQETLPYGCNSCERRFRCRSALNIHMAWHLGVQDLPYKCDICNKKFRFKDDVSKHIRKIHQNEKNYQCDICSMTFFEKRPFVAHMAGHSDKKPYKCDMCDLAFKMQDALRRHRVSVHSDVRKFQCTVCSKSFKLHSSLWAHMVVHTKEKRYPCRVCGVRFGRSHHRSRHELTAHQKHLKTE